MALTVAEIMSRDLFSVRPADAAEDALDGILALAIGGAPVLDEEQRPVGAVSVRDLVGRRPGDRVEDRMSRPADTVPEGASVVEAARLLAESGRQRLAAVDVAGRAVGIVTPLDALRGLLGLQAASLSGHRPFALSSALVWSDELPLEPAMFCVAGDGPGLLVLLHEGPGSPKRVVWAEACDSVRRRLLDMLEAPQAEEPLLAFWLKRPGLRFRSAAAPDPAQRREAARDLRRRADLPTTESWI